MFTVHIVTIMILMLLFDVIVFYSNACLELSVRDEYLHRTTTASIYAKLMFSVVVGDGVV